MANKKKKRGPRPNASPAENKGGIYMKIPVIAISGVLVLAAGIILGMFVFSPLFNNTDDTSDMTTVLSDTEWHDTQPVNTAHLIEH